MALTCQTDSKIANATGTWQENCNINVTGYATDAEFIIASYALADSVNPDSDFKLQWRRAAGVFADVAVDTEICWGTATSLVDGNPVANPAGCLATVDDDIENEGDNLAHLDNIANGKYCEIQWALGFGSGVQNSQEYELQLVSVDWANDAVLQTSITTAAAGATEIDAPDNSSPTEVTVPAIDGVRLLDAPDNQSPTEITVPSLDGVRLIDAADNQSPTEITAPSLHPLEVINAADNSSPTEVSSAILDAVRLIDAADNQTPTEVTAPTVQVVAGIEDINAADVSSPTKITAPSFGKIIDLTKYSPAFA